MRSRQAPPPSASGCWSIRRIYTAGTSARAGDLLDARFPVFKTGRGGAYTYHGPGQRVAYVMLDLNAARRDVRAFVHDLEEWLIATLAAVRRQGRAARRPDRHLGRRGDGREDKIAAIGVRVRHWVTFHGVALNVESRSVALRRHRALRRARR